MKKENIPKIFTVDIINIILTVIPFIAIFSFWNDLKDIEKIFYIVIPFIIIISIVNVIKYCIKVKKLYKKYEELYNNNQALAQNYKDNVNELKQEQYNNEILRDFSNRAINLLLVYNELTKEERSNLRKELISKFINGNIKEGENNE
ncbi:MAG: hypothetical protein MR411_03355 [Tenericutes bacterium]|nr:hypothetical protein [Mycoplasmatota bacterium]MDY3800630.1 hypothetical protein [Bacilli bacterium]